MTNLFRREIAYPVLLLSFLMGFAISAQGHDPRLSSLTAVVMDRQIDLVLGLAVRDAETVAAEISNGNPTSQDFAAIKPVLESLVSRSIKVYFGNELAEVRQAVATAHQRLSEAQSLLARLPVR